MLTETSPGDIEFVVATDANGDTPFTALHLDGSSTANVADLLVKLGTYLKLEDGNFTQWIRPSSGTAQDTTIILPSKSGVLGRAEDIPTSVTNLTDVTSAGSGAIITDDERTKLEGVAPSATANETDAFLLERANHTGTQAASTISDFDTEVSNNTDVAANTAKVGITTQQADDITANNAKVSLIAGGTTGQALVKSTGTDYDVEWSDIAVDVQYHNRFQTDAETFRSGATETVELYYTAKADGDGLAESASSDTPAAGYDIRRKLYYSEAGFADPDTGTWTQFTAIADNTTFANAKAALLAYLKERTGGTVPISLKMTWEEVAQAPAFTGLLNESYGSGASAAYSVRRLNGNYTGAAIQVERSSDNTTQDIGFDSNGDLDESALSTFCSGTVCKVRTWYGQEASGGTGSGNDAVQTVHANQPTIYTGGAIVKENGRVAVDFDGSTNVLTNTALQNSFEGAAQAFTMLHVAQTDDTSNFQYSFSLLDGANATPSQNDQFGLILANDNKSGGFIRDYSTSTTSFPKSSAAVGTSQHLNTAVNTGSTLSVYASGTAGDSVSVNYPALAFDYASVGGRYGGSTPSSDTLWNGKIQEILAYASDKSTDRTSIESNIGDYFTQNTPLLDTYSGAAAAYSLRLLDSTYTGALINVWNGTSYADIYPNVFGELDTVALAAHCGSNDGFIRYWYDQSSNSNTATQTTTANMPKIYDGTTGVITENGKPAIETNDTPTRMVMASSVTVHSGFFVYRKTADKVLSTLVGTDGNSQIDGGGTASSFNRAITASDGTNITRATTAADNTSQFLGSVHLGATSSVRINGSQEATGTTSTFSVDGVFQRTNLDGDNRYVFVGRTQEIILYDSAQSGTDISGIEDNINTFYSIYS